jgi:hypothetical protein
MLMRAQSRALRWSMSFAAFVACSGGKEQPASDAPEKTAASPAARADDDGCRLFTKSEAAAALGSPIDKGGKDAPPTPMGTVLRGTCFYRSEDGGTAQLTVDTHPDADAASAKYQTLRRRYRGGHDISGVGEASFVHNQVLVAQRGNVHVTVNLDPEGANKIVNYSDTKAMDALHEIERGIATRALERLPASGQSVASAESANSARSACSMIPKEEMEAILGGALSFAVPSDNAASTTCTYTGTGGRYAQVAVEWQGGESGMAGSNLAGALMNAASGGDVKASNEIKGLGDEAVMIIGGVLNVRKGAALISVDLRMQKGYEQKARAIAERVLTKI